MNEEELVQQYQEKIDKIARGFIHKYRINSFTIDDIKQELFCTLIRAARKFDPTRHTQFNTFFTRSVQSVLADLQKYCGTRWKLHNYSPIDEVIKVHDGDYQKVSRDLRPFEDKKVYSFDFKLQAVKEVVKSKNISEVAKKLGTSTSQLRNWRRQFKEMAAKQKEQ